MIISTNVVLMFHLYTTDIFKKGEQEMNLKKLFSTPLKASLTIISLIAIIALLSTGSVYAASSIAQNSSIGAENAKIFSFADAGIDPTTAKAVQTEFEYEQGQFVYEVEFTVDGTEYEYWINASNGAVVKKNIEIVSLGDGNAVVSNNQISLEKAEEIALSDSKMTDNKVTSTKKNTTNVKENKADSKNNAAKPVTSKQQETTNQITLDAAKAKALADADVTSSRVTYTEAKLEYDDGIPVYDIEFYTSTHEYEYEINAATGKVHDKDVEKLESNKGNKQKRTDEAKSQDNSSRYIGIDKAKAIAVDYAGLSISDVTFSKAKLDTDDGNTFYEIEFYKDGIEYEYEIDASSGKILEYDTEQDD